MKHIIFITVLLSVATQSVSIAPILEDGTVADWWFSYKFNAMTYNSNKCTGQHDSNGTCTFGGQFIGNQAKYGLNFATIHHQAGITSKLQMPSGNSCIGSGENDSLANTFSQIYNRVADNFVIWSDQFYGYPLPSQFAPWGHSKGALAWDGEGNGVLIQVTTPDWPKSGVAVGNSSDPNKGNTLGCNPEDNNLYFGQHFFSLKLNQNDVLLVLEALAVASAVTDPFNPLLVQHAAIINHTFSKAVSSLGQLSMGKTPFDVTLSSGVRLISKPSNLNVAPWQMVGAMINSSLRTATWWDSPFINSTHPIDATSDPQLCWSSDLPKLIPEIQIATTGTWKGKPIGLTAGFGNPIGGNHAKIGVTVGNSLTVFGDMNQQGCVSSSTCKCNSSQNGRGGMFFVVDDGSLHDDVSKLLQGKTAPYSEY